MGRNNSAVVLDSLVRLTRLKDAEQLEISLTKTIFDLFDATTVSLFRVLQGGMSVYSVVTVSHAGMAQLHRTADVDAAAAPFMTELAAASEARATVRVARADCDIVIHPIILAGSVAGFLTITAVPGSDIDDVVVASFLSVYGNYYELLVDNQHDTLTGLLNRKTFEDRLVRYIHEFCAEPLDSSPLDGKAPGRDTLGCEVPARKPPTERWGFWLGILDVDNFKRINDTFGHAVGDDVLVTLAGIIRRSFRSGDIKLRYGGEEFIVVIRADDRADAVSAFERFRQNVERHRFEHVGQVTVSIGLIEVAKSEKTSKIVSRADQALYQAKKAGKNRTRVFGERSPRGRDTATVHAELAMFA